MAPFLVKCRSIGGRPFFFPRNSSFLSSLSPIDCKGQMSKQLGIRSLASIVAQHVVVCQVGQKDAAPFRIRRYCFYSIGWAANQWRNGNLPARVRPRCYPSRDSRVPLHLIMYNNIPPDHRHHPFNYSPFSLSLLRRYFSSRPFNLSVLNLVLLLPSPRRPDIK